MNNTYSTKKLQNPFFSINTTSYDLQYLRLPYLVERIKYYYSKKFEQDWTILTEVIHLINIES
ncbi:hypothetical protein BLOT_002712 [Blomia tropicalis]|nr:hypothetical protein BLOT_002712 [Blomia tropicalis]